MTRWLLTGGTGSLGQALARRILADDTERTATVIIYSRDELKQAQMAAAFGSEGDLIGGRLRFVLGDVRDRARLDQVIGDVDYVIHAAALKRVDAIVYNPGETVLTNVIGTENVCRAAIAAGVQRVITVSSDKAVHPTNLYGASKQLAEHLTVGANIYAVKSGTRLACVRYGNVLGSRGSVVTLWRDALRNDRPLRITEPSSTRFWMTLEQACTFVLWALAEQQGGEIFVPSLPATTIGALADAMIAEQHGRAAVATYPRETIGIRPGGEKFHEMLVSEEEISRTSRRAPYFFVAPHARAWTTEPYRTSDGPGFPVHQFHSGQATRLSFDDLRAALRSVP